MSNARIYRRLLVLYPRAFREAYGPDLVQLFQDQCRDEPTAIVIMRTAVDLAVSVPTLHLEAHMHRNPSRVVSAIYLAVAAAGIAVAVVGGTTLRSLTIGVSIALIAGTVGTITLRRAGPATTSAGSGTWWKLLAAGPVLVGVVIIGAGVGIEAWFLGLATIAVAVSSVAIGTVLGIVQLLARTRRAGATAP